MKKKVLYILAPNDRFNYGDLLFPYVLKYYIGKEFDKIRYISTTQSDLSNLGGIPTEAYEELYDANNDESDNYLIVAGGESLFSDWSVIMAFVDSKYHCCQSLLRKLFFFKKSIGRRIYKSYVKLTLPTKTKYPFTIGKNELLNFKGIYYNSVGGIGLDSLSGAKLLQKKDERNVLNSVDYLSVRDKYTCKALISANIENTLVADSAIMMSEVFTDEILENNLSINNKLLDKPYLFFQGNKLYLEKESSKIAEELFKLQQETNLKICLCPIGTALGHEDIEGLNSLIPFLNQKGVSYIMIDSPNLFDIMWLIKYSKLYIGTSLHGIITSMSFRVPYVGYCKRKLMTYIYTWDEEVNFTDSVEGLYLTSINSLRTQTNLSKLQLQKATVSKSFKHMVNLINEH